MYGLSNGIKNFDLSWSSVVEVHGHTLKNFEVEYLENSTR